MQIVLVILLIALGWVFWKRETLGNRANPLMGGLVVLSLLFVVLSITRSSGQGSSPIKAAKGQLPFFTAAAVKLGQAIATALPDGGKIVVIHNGGAGDVSGMINQARIEGLKKGFGAAKIEIIEAGPRTEEEFEAIFALESEMPMDLYVKYLDAAPDAKAVVSMIGPPRNVRAPRPLPPLYLLEMVDRQMAEDLLRAGAIAGAVVQKEDADWKAQAASGMSDDDIFNLRYQLLPANR